MVVRSEDDGYHISIFERRAGDKKKIFSGSRSFPCFSADDFKRKDFSKKFICCCGRVMKNSVRGIEIGVFKRQYAKYMWIILQYLYSEARDVPRSRLVQLRVAVGVKPGGVYIARSKESKLRRPLVHKADEFFLAHFQGEDTGCVVVRFYKKWIEQRAHKECFARRKFSCASLFTYGLLQHGNLFFQIKIFNRDDCCHKFCDACDR